MILPRCPAGALLSGATLPTAVHVQVEVAGRADTCQLGGSFVLHTRRSHRCRLRGGKQRGRTLHLRCKSRVPPGPGRAPTPTCHFHRTIESYSGQAGPATRSSRWALRPRGHLVSRGWTLSLRQIPSETRKWFLRRKIVICRRERRPGIPETWPGPGVGPRAQVAEWPARAEWPDLQGLPSLCRAFPRSALLWELATLRVTLHVGGQCPKTPRLPNPARPPRAFASFFHGRW